MLATGWKVQRLLRPCYHPYCLQRPCLRRPPPLRRKMEIIGDLFLPLTIIFQKSRKAPRKKLPSSKLPVPETCIGIETRRVKKLPTWSPHLEPRVKLTSVCSKFTESAMHLSSWSWWLTTLSKRSEACWATFWRASISNRIDASMSMTTAHHLTTSNSTSASLVASWTTIPKAWEI